MADPVRPPWLSGSQGEPSSLRVAFLDMLVVGWEEAIRLWVCFQSELIDTGEKRRGFLVSAI